MIVFLLYIRCVSRWSLYYIYIVNDASSDSHIVVKRNISVVTRQLLLYLCDVICVMTSHPRSLLAQLVCICVCIHVSRVNGCWVHGSYFNVNNIDKTLKVLSWWRIFTKRTFHKLASRYRSMCELIKREFINYPVCVCACARVCVCACVCVCMCLYCFGW